MLLFARSPVRAQASLIADLGGPLGFGTDSLPRDDDSVFVEVDVTPTFPTGLQFFGTRATSIFVNNNGNLTLGGSVATFTPTSFAPGAPRPMIAAWWGDVDTRRVPDPPEENLVYYAVEPGRIVVTWFLVDYFREHGDHRNSFQIVLTPAPGEPEGTVDLEFRYAQCEWTTGDASGGSGGFGGQPAAAGIDEGPRPAVDGGAADAGSIGAGYLTLPGSRTMDVLELCRTSNVGMRGVWRIQVRGGAIVPMCGNFFVDVGEECDDGDRDPRDGCDEDCLIEGCGNRRVETDQGETCDDGNRTSGDGCSASCLTEPPDAGPPEPDAGFDAGRDAGPDRVIVGGGGCSCAVASSDVGRTGGGTVLVVAGGLVVSAAARGRARRRAGRCSR